MAVIDLTGKRDEYKRTDGGTASEEFKRAAYNAIILIKVTTADGQVYTVHMDINRDCLKLIDRKDWQTTLSYWIGQFIQFTTTDDFIANLVIPALEKFSGSNASDALADLNGLWRSLRADRTRKLGKNTAITTGCKSPMFMFYDEETAVRAAGSAGSAGAEVVLQSPTRERPAFDGVIAQYENASTGQGFTSYFMLCPSLYVPTPSNLKKTKQANNVLFFCTEPGSKFKSGESTYHFPEYDDKRSDLAIGASEGEVFVDSLGAVHGSNSPVQTLSSSAPSPSNTDRTDNKKKLKLTLALADAAQAQAQALSAPPPSSLGVDTEVPIQQSFFKSIINKFLSFFNLAKIGDHTQHTTVFIVSSDSDELWLDKLWVRLLIDVADEVADEVEHNFLGASPAVAATHAHSSAVRLTEVLDPLTDRSIQRTVDIAIRSAEVAKNAAIYVTSRHMVSAPELACIAAFAARIVACVYACDRVEIDPSLSRALPQELADVCREFFEGIETISSSTDEKGLNDAVEKCFQYARSHVETVIKITEAALAVPSGHRGDDDDMKAFSEGGRRRRRFLHRVSSKRRRTLKKKNISRKYFKHSSSGDGGTRRRCRRRCRCRRNCCYSRKITIKM
jgi:hypothetical protein